MPKHPSRAAALVAAVFFTAPAVAETWEVASGSQVRFDAKITASSFTAKSKGVTGEVDYDPATGVLASATVKVDASSFTTGVGLRDEHMRDNYLEAGAHPEIVFELGSGTLPLEKGATATLDGAFTVKGVRREAKVPVRIKKVKKDKTIVEAAFPLNITDYGIEQPSYLVVKMETILAVRVELVLRPKG